MIYFGLLLFFVLEYVRPASYVPALLPLHLNAIVPISNFLGTVAFRGSAAAERVFASGNSWIVGGCLLIMGVSVLFSSVTEYAYSGFSSVLGYAMAYVVLLSEVRTIRRLDGVVMVMLLVHVVVAALNPVLFTDPDGRNYISSGSFLGDGNDFALSVNIVIPFCVYLLLNARRWPAKFLWGLTLLVLVGIVILTKSRGGTLALGATAFAYWLGTQRKLQMAMLAAVTLAGVLLFAPPSYFERMQMIGDTQEGSAAGRLAAWGAGIRMAFDNPLLGVGVGHFGVKYGKEYHPEDARPGEKTAHSLFFLALGELGLPGFGLVVGFFIYNLSANRTLARDIRGRDPSRTRELDLLQAATVAVVAFGVGGAFLSCLYYPHLYILCGLTAATRRLLLDQREATPARAAAPKSLSLHPALAPAGPGVRRSLR